MLLKYTPEEFAKATDKYFKSISRIETLRDNNGEEILPEDGEPLTFRKYYQPPSITNLCNYLKITRETLRNYKDKDKAYLDTYIRARQLILGYTEIELHTREKNVEGIKFSLTYNFPEIYKDTRDINLNANMVVDNVTALPLEDKIKALEGLRQLTDGNL